MAGPCFWQKSATGGDSSRWALLVQLIVFLKDSLMAPHRDSTMFDFLGQQI